MEECLKEVRGENGVHLYSYEGFAYIKVEKSTSHPRAQSNSPTAKKKTGFVKCYMFRETLARCVTLFLSGNEHIVRTAGLVLREVAGNLLAVLFLSACLNRDGVFILRTTALRTL